VLKSLAAPLAAYLKARNEMLMVSGFTDDRQVRGGNRPFADNWELSAQRALTVTRALIEEGIASGSVFAAAFGAEQAVASNADADGRSKNRRVEMAPTPKRSDAPTTKPRECPQVTVRDSDPGALIDAWRARGDDRVDPVRFRLIEALARRGAGHEGEARRILDDKLHDLLRVYGEALDEPTGGDRAAAKAPHPAPPGPLAALVEGLALKPPVPAADTLAYLRNTWSRLSAERSLTQSLATVPENAGPLNSQQLMHRSLTLMRDLSPDYLHRFMSYVDALLRLDRGFGSNTPAGPESARTEPPKKARRKAR
jgi:hypothetical protein